MRCDGLRMSCDGHSIWCDGNAMRCEVMGLLWHNILWPDCGPAMHDACDTQFTRRSSFIKQRQKEWRRLTKDETVSSFTKSTNQMSRQTCRRNYSTASYGVLWSVVSKHSFCYCRNRRSFVIVDTAEIIMAFFTPEYLYLYYGLLFLCEAIN